MYRERTYRRLMSDDRLQTFRVVVQETDLWVHADRKLEKMTRNLIIRYRAHLEGYLQAHPAFGTTLKPWRLHGPAPNIVRDMAAAGVRAGVGPMAAVAGAMAERVGCDLLSHCGAVIVENGGDVFLKADQPVTIGIFAGQSPLSLRIGLRVDASRHPMAACTSSGTVGHSLSLGSADAVCVVSESCPLADAVATALANRVRCRADIEKTIEAGRKIVGVEGIVIIIGEDIGLWGALEVIGLEGKKG